MNYGLARVMYGFAGMIYGEGGLKYGMARNLGIIYPQGVLDNHPGAKYGTLAGLLYGILGP